MAKHQTPHQCYSFLFLHFLLVPLSIDPTIMTMMMMMICIIRYVNNDINLQNPIHLYTRKEKTIIKLSDFIWGKKKIWWQSWIEMMLRVVQIDQLRKPNLTFRIIRQIFSAKIKGIVFFFFFFWIKKIKGIVIVLVVW